jgi:tetratricopeptide (TPR) repeat protein
MNTAISNDPNCVSFLMNRAQCHYELKQFNEAIEDLESALKINQTDPQVHYKLGLAYFAFEKYRRSIKVKCVLIIRQTFKHALKNKPYLTYEADIYYHIGLAYCHLEKFEKAIYPFTRVRLSV